MSWYKVIILVCWQFLRKIRDILKLECNSIINCTAVASVRILDILNVIPGNTGKH